MNQRTFPTGLNDQLTIDDLRAYRAGQLSGTAIHQVERILLENPFYADALDGLDALQQVGENLHTHTRDLHIAFQELAGETATPRRLMPLWVTSAAASIVLVICVAIYYFFYVIPAGTSAQATSAIEPGTILIDPKALGMGEPAQKSATSNTVATATESLEPRSSVKASWTNRKRSTHAPVRQHSTSYPAETQLSPQLSPEIHTADYTLTDRDILPLPISQADIQRRHLIDTERAFER